MSEEKDQNKAPAVPPAIAEKLRIIEARKADLAAARATRAAAESLPPSPEDVLRSEEEALARMEREEADEQAWRAALAKHGKGRVVRIPTPGGIIILRARTGAQVDADAARIGGVQNAGGDVITVARDCLMGQTVHPTLERAGTILEVTPGFWTTLYQARDALDFGQAEDFMGKL